MPRDGKPAKKSAAPRVQCLRSGCTGSCPLAVVTRSNKADGAPAKCFVCDQQYRVPKGAQQLLAAAKAAPRRAARAPAQEGDKDVGQLAKEVRELKKKLEQKPPPEVPKQDADGPIGPAQERLDKLVALLGPEHDEVLRQKQVVENERAKKAAAKPLRFQLRDAQQKADKANKALAANVELQSDLQTKLEAAKQEHEGLASRANALTAQVNGLHQKSLLEDAAGGASTATASVVRGWFGNLPAQVATHPQAQETMQAIMQMFDKLHAAAAGAAPPATLDEAATLGQPTDNSANAAPVEASRQASTAGGAASVPVGPSADGGNELDEAMEDEYVDALALQLTPKQEDESDEEHKRRVEGRRAECASVRSGLVKKSSLKK